MGNYQICIVDWPISACNAVKDCFKIILETGHGTPFLSTDRKIKSYLETDTTVQILFRNGNDRQNPI